MKIFRLPTTCSYVLIFVAAMITLFLPTDLSASGDNAFAKEITNIGQIQKSLQTKDGFILVIRNSSQRRIILRKIDLTGKQVWQRELAGSFPIVPEGVDKSTDDGVFLTVSNRNGLGKFAVLKLNADGTIEWSLGFQQPQQCDDFQTPTLSKFDSIVGTPDGGALALGPARSGFCIDPTGIELALVKFSSSGAIEWSKFLQGGFGGFGGQIQLTSNGGFVVSIGHSLVRLDSTGEIESANSIKNKKFALYPDRDGGIVFLRVDHGAGKLFLAKQDAREKFVWKKSVTFNNIRPVNASLEVKLPPDSGYLIFGSVSSSTSKLSPFLTEATIDGKIQSITVLGDNRLGHLQNVYKNSAGGNIVFGNEKNHKSIFYSGGSDILLPECLLSSNVKASSQPFALSKHAIDLTEGSLVMISARLHFQSRAFQKRDSNLCP